MYKKKAAPLYSTLLAITLSLLAGHVAAQNSSSDFEQALRDAGWSVWRDAEGNLILIPGKPETPENETTPGNRAETAPDQWQQLQDALQATGWKVEREADGSLLLMPPGPAPSAPSSAESAPADAETAPAIAESVPAITESLPAGIVTTDSMQDFKQRLQDAGWFVTTDPDGSLLLYPPGMIGQPEPAAPAPVLPAPDTQAAPTPTPAEADSVPAITQSLPAGIVTTDSMQDFKQKLEDAGWFVTTDRDGSLLLYPPGMIGQPGPASPAPDLPTSIAPAAATQPPVTSVPVTEATVMPAAAAPAPAEPPPVPAASESSADNQAGGKPEPVAGTPPRVEVALPVNSWQEAYDISSAWVDSQPEFEATVGKIRKILRVYLVSIVTAEEPYTLLQQIAIRTSDGAVIVLN